MKPIGLARALLVGLAVFFFGCGDGGGQPIELRSELKTEPAPQGPAVAPDIHVEGKNLVIRVPMTLPDPCHKVVHKAKMEGGEIFVSLQIENPPAGTICIQVLTTVIATVTLFDLPSGTDTLTLQTPLQTTQQTVRIP